MAQQFDDRQARGRGQNTTTTETNLDKAKLPEQNREELRSKFKRMDDRKGAVALNEGVRDRSTDYGRDAIGDPVRTARPQMMAMISTVLPELSASPSPQRDALIKAFENPAIIRSYLINPQDTAALLIQRFPDFKDSLLKNMPFQKVGNHLEVNPDSGLYQRISQEVAAGVKPSNSFVRKEMDKLLSSFVAAGLGGSMGMETKAYELIRNRIEKPGFNKEAERIELRMSKLMESPQARQDLKEVQGLARLGALPSAIPTAPPTTAQPQIAGNIPALGGGVVNGADLKPAAAPAGAQPTITTPPASAPGAAAQQGIPLQGGGAINGANLKPAAPPSPAQPGIAAQPTTTPPASPQQGIPLQGGGTVAGADLKPAAPPAAAQPTTAPAATQPTIAPAAPTPDAAKLTQENKELVAKNATLEEVVKKNTEMMEAMMKKLSDAETRYKEAEQRFKETEAKLNQKDPRIDALSEQLKKAEERANRAELGGKVDRLLQDKGQKIASSAEFSDALTVVKKPDQSAFPDADAVVAKIEEVREKAKQSAAQQQKDLDTMISGSMQLAPDASLEDTRRWADSNMDLYNSLKSTPGAQKTFTTYIQKTYQFRENQELSDPMRFFERKIADVATQNILAAKKSPSPGGPERYDTVKISQILRSLNDTPNAKLYIEKDPKVQSMMSTLPEELKQSLDARLKRGVAKQSEAEVYLIRSLVLAGADQEHRKHIKEARSADPSQTAAIDTLYKKTFGTELKDDIKKANQVALDRAKKAQEEAERAKKKAEEAASQTKDID